MPLIRQKVPPQRPVSAKTSTGHWPPSPATLDAIRTDVDAAGARAKGDVRAYIFIAACIGGGIDAGTHIREAAGMLGLNQNYICLLLRMPNAPWRKGADGRYGLT